MRENQIDNKKHYSPKTGGKRRLLRGLIAIVVLAVTAGAVVWGFLESREEQSREAEREKPARAAARVAAGTGVIRIEQEARERSGIATARLPLAPYIDRIRAYGMVLDASRITELSNSYVNAAALLRMAQAKAAFSRAAFDRARKLYDSDRSISQAQLEQAEAAWRTDEATVGSAESQVQTLVATAHQEWGPVLGKALVTRSQTIVRLIERQDFLLQVTLPPGVSAPKDVTAAAIESVVKGRDNRADNRRAAITLVSPATRTDARIQGVSYFYLAPADSGVLPGMNVLAFLETGASADGVAVPAEALVWWQDRPWVYRRAEPETFVRTEIATDQPTPGGGYIDRRLGKDAEVVTRGAQLLLSEEFRAQLRVGGD
jgi:hypothetical protein